MRSIPLALLAAVSISSPASAQVLFNSNGFEPGTYATGNLIGQNGWTIDATTTTATSVSYAVQSAVVAGGTQAVRATGSGGNAFALPPAFNLTPAAGETVQVQADIARSAPGATPTTDYSINVADTAQRTAALYGLIENGGAIQPYVFAPFNTTTQQFDAASSPITVAIGNPVAANTFVNFDARLNYSTKTLRLFVNGTDVGSNIPFVDADVTNLNEVDFAIGNANLSDVGYFDNLAVTLVPVPEPTATLAVAGLAVAGLSRVRRKRTA